MSQYGEANSYFAVALQANILPENQNKLLEKLTAKVTKANCKSRNWIGQQLPCCSLTGKHLAWKKSKYIEELSTEVSIKRGQHIAC